MRSGEVGLFGWFARGNSERIGNGGGQVLVLFEAKGIVGTLLILTNSSKQKGSRFLCS